MEAWSSIWLGSKPVVGAPPILEPILVVGFFDVHWGLTDLAFEKPMATCPYIPQPQAKAPRIGAEASGGRESRGLGPGAPRVREELGLPHVLAAPLSSGKKRKDGEKGKNGAWRPSVAGSKPSHP